VSGPLRAERRDHRERIDPDRRRNDGVQSGRSQVVDGSNPVSRCARDEAGDAGGDRQSHRAPVTTKERERRQRRRARVGAVDAGRACGPDAMKARRRVEVARSRRCRHHLGQAHESIQENAIAPRPAHRVGGAPLELCIGQPRCGVDGIHAPIAMQAARALARRRNLHKIRRSMKTSFAKLVILRYACEYQAHFDT
jgi:hypothetical protein